MKRLIFSLIAYIFLFIPNPALTVAKKINEKPLKPASTKTKLRSLVNLSSKTFDLRSPHAAIYMIYQPNCGSCLKQVKKFSCLKAPIYLIGAYGSEQSLRLEYKKMKTTSPAFMINAEVERVFKPVEGLTPQIIGVNGKLRFNLLGDTDCSDIQNTFLGKS